MTSSTGYGFNPSWASAFAYEPSIPYDFSQKLDLNFGSSTKTSGGNMFDPASLAIAGLGAGIGALSGFGQQRTAANIANAQMAAQADALKQGILFQRDSAKANIGLGMFGQIYGSTTGADLEFGRQVAAKRREFAEFMPKESGLARERARWDLDFRSGPAFKNYTRQENLLNLQSNPTLIADRAAKTGMFGRIAQAPIESLMV